MSGSKLRSLKDAPTNVQSELNEFERYIFRIKEKYPKELFFNSGTEKSVISLSQIINQAKYKVVIFAQSLCDLEEPKQGNPAQYKEYIDSLSGFLESAPDNSKSLQVLLQKNINGQEVEQKLKENNQALWELFVLFKEKVDLRFTTANISQRNSNTPINFTIADQRAYRLEYDVDTRSAECCFDDPFVCSVLEAKFDTIFASAIRWSIN